MRTSRPIILGGVLVLLTIAAVAGMAAYRQHSRTSPRSAGTQTPAPAETSVRSNRHVAPVSPEQVHARTPAQEPAAEDTAAALPNAGQTRRARDKVAPRAAQDAVPQPTPMAAGNNGPKEPVQNPLARAALSYVGTDPLAEVVWHEAINDPSLPADERKNLIEDLNEDGFADPKNPTRDEIPLILSRLELVESLANEALDEVDADAFAEAHKDLTDMYLRLTAQ